MSSVTPPIPDPYRPPEPTSLPVGARAAAEVSGPAVGLIITAIIGGVLHVGSLLVNMLGAGLGSITATGREEQIFNWLSGGVGMVSSTVGLLIAGIVIYAAIEMKNLRQWGLAVAASILAMIPCISPCCVLGIPMGIWSLVVLLKDEVKTAFR